MTVTMMIDIVAEYEMAAVSELSRARPSILRCCSCAYVVRGVVVDTYLTTELYCRDCCHPSSATKRRLNARESDEYHLRVHLCARSLTVSI